MRVNNDKLRKHPLLRNKTGWGAGHYIPVHVHVHVHVHKHTP